MGHGFKPDNWALWLSIHMHPEVKHLYMQMLRCTHGAMELLDVSTELPSLKRLPGKTSWLVRDKAGFSSAFSPVRPSPAFPVFAPRLSLLSGFIGNPCSTYILPGMDLSPGFPNLLTSSHSSWTPAHE